MSLAIVFKGAEGIVLAADSRLTVNTPSLVAGVHPGLVVFQASAFDNATKLLRVKGQDFVAAVTYGSCWIEEGPSGDGPRTANSFIPDFEAELQGNGRLGVQEFAERLSGFFLGRWNANMPAVYAGQGMHFLVAGYDAGAPYGTVFEVRIPSDPTAQELMPGTQFGVVYGGQTDLVQRLLEGFAQELPSHVAGFLGLPAEKGDELRAHLQASCRIPVPYSYLPLQDSVDLCIFLVRVTMSVQKWTTSLRGVGGAVDVAVITRTGGFRSVQQKTVMGEQPGGGDAL